MRPNDENPCAPCPDKGCGRQAQCPDYMAYYNRNRERDKKQLEQAMLNNYTTQAIYEAKKGNRSSINKYRPKERW